MKQYFVLRDVEIFEISYSAFNIKVVLFYVVSFSFDDVAGSSRS